MSNYGQWRRWFHNQAALHDFVTALTYETPAAPPLERKIGRNQVRNLMYILVPSIDATLLQLTGDSDYYVVIRLDNLRRRALSPGAIVDALLVQARTLAVNLSNIVAYLQYHATVNGAILSAAPEHLAATPAEQLKRVLAGLQDIPWLSFLEETPQEVAEVERIIRRGLATGSAALAAVATTPKRNNDKAPRNNRMTRKIGEGGTCTHLGRFVHKPSEYRCKSNATAVVAATDMAFSVDEIRAACAADTSAAIQEAFKTLLAAQATSGKDATSDYPLSPRIIFDSDARTTILPATTPLDKRTPASVRISLANGTGIREPSRLLHSTHEVWCSIAAQGTRGPVVPGGTTCGA
jgi:hypothetical protein